MHVNEWTAEKNKEIFGLCNNENYHGHNYELQVKLTGEVDPTTGFVFDLKVLKDIIEKYVVADLDHKNLNLDVPDFANINPTAENISIAIWKRLRPVISPNLELSVRLYETPRNFVDYNG